MERGGELHAGTCGPSPGHCHSLHLKAAGGTSSEEMLARFIMERGESFSWRGSSVNNRENTARSARQRRARTPAPAFISLLLSKSFRIKEAALESNTVWKE